MYITKSNLIPQQKKSFHQSFLRIQQNLTNFVVLVRFKCKTQLKFGIRIKKRLNIASQMDLKEKNLTRHKCGWTFPDLNAYFGQFHKHFMSTLRQYSCV